MTRERLEELKAKPHGPDVAALIAEVERLWALVDRMVQLATAPELSRDKMAEEGVVLASEADVETVLRCIEP